MLRKRTTVVVLAALCLVAPTQGQQRRGRRGLAVQVLTSDKQPVAGAEIKVAPPGSLEPQSGVTDESGLWRTRLDRDGQTSVEVRKQGFKPVRQEFAFTGRLLLTVSLAAEMEIQQSTASVSTEVGQTLSGSELERLPLDDRRSMNAVGTTGASVFLGYDGGGKASFSLGGGRAQSQAFSIDGGNGQSMRLGKGHTEFDPAVEELSELRVVTNGYAAEHGGSTGGLLAAKIKSGSNRFSGSLFEFLRNDKLDAANYFAQAKAPLRYNVFGGTLGGPVKRDKTFFFFSYEGARRVEGSTRVMTVPTDLERSGDFSQSLNNQGRPVAIYDPFSARLQGSRTVRDPFPGNLIAQTRLDAVARNLIEFYPRANTIPSGISNANNFTGNSARETVRDHLTVKGDHLLTSSDRLSTRYVYDTNHQKVRSVFPNPAADNQTQSLSNSHNAFVSWTRTGSRLVNDFRFTYSRRNNHQVSNGVGGDWPSRLGLSGVPDAAFPRFQASGYAPLGAANQERIQFPVEQWQFLEMVSTQRGAHRLKFGFEVRPSHNVERDLAIESGAFTFNPQGTGQPGQPGTGNSFASLLLGFPYTFQQRMTETLDRSSRYYSAFLQDDWQAHRRLTMNFGLRWEADSAMHDANHRMNGFDPNAVNPVSGTAGVVRFAGIDGWPDTLYRTDWNNFGPRFGFAWRVPVSWGTVVRGGYGMFFGHPFDRGVTTAASLGFELSARLISPDNGVTAPFILSQGVPVSAQAPLLNNAFGAVAVGQTPTTSVAYFDPNRATGYAHQYHLSVQQPLAGQTVLEVSFLGNLGRKLPGGNLTINQIPPELMGPEATQALRPFPQFADVQLLAPSIGVSSYHAGVVRLERRLRGGLQFQTSYTWSKALANVDGGEGGRGGNGSASAYSDLYNRAADWGPADSDIRHRLAWSSTYDLPFRNWLARGWALGSIVTLQSAPPFTVTTQVNSTGAFSAGPLRADVLGDPTLPSAERTVAQWFDTSMFAQPAPFAFGSQGVNILRGDSLVNFDFSILRNLRFGDRFTAQFRGELYNAFNHPNFGLPGSVLGAADFGVVDNAMPGRRVQVALRLTF